ncbi:hypothetical protein WN51_08505 [Melipona quadrifasciata]|uniref:Uncharacterized protein n=1 Tax=Melipona quadrifasciata TaxID=166423 RepID=A0A0M9A8Q0_9HYME|nr:hypothetical protein WN51_08505 [Melipona quadrifasciata]
MARNKRPVRGGKRKFHRFDNQPKPKKGKFNLKEASYVKDRNAKNKEIEKRRQILEEEKLQQQQNAESDDSGNEQENPLQNLLSSFSNTSNLQLTAIESNSESNSSSDDIEENDKLSDNLKVHSNNTDEEAELMSDNEEIKMKEVDEEDPETAKDFQFISTMI